MFYHFLDSRSIYPWLSFVNGDWWENSCLKKRRQRRIETHQPQGRNYHITALPLFASRSWQIHRNASDKSDFCQALITYLPQFVRQIQHDNSAGVWFVISISPMQTHFRLCDSRNLNLSPLCKLNRGALPKLWAPAVSLLEAMSCLHIQ